MSKRRSAAARGGQTSCGMPGHVPAEGWQRAGWPALEARPWQRSRRELYWKDEAGLAA
jgi:hypothetical protein